MKAAYDTCGHSYSTAAVDMKNELHDYKSAAIGEYLRQKALLICANLSLSVAKNATQICVHLSTSVAKKSTANLRPSEPICGKQTHHICGKTDMIASNEIFFLA